MILDDVDARALSLASWQALAERVRGGAGLMMTGGYHSFGPGGFRETPLADVLPIDIGPAQRQNFDEPLRTDVQLAGPGADAARRAARHPTPDHAARRDDGNRLGRRCGTNLPPLDGANLIDRRDLKPNAAVLAEADDARRHPLLGGRSAGRRPRARLRRRLDLALADARLRRRPSPLLAAGRAVARQERRADRGPRLDQARRPPRDARHARRLHARRRKLAAANRSPRPGSTSRSKRPTAARVDVRPTKSGDHWSAIFRETDKPGDYRIKVTAERRRADELGTAEARFLVPDQDIELDRPAAEPSLMAQLAEMTAAAGGKALAPEELPDAARHARRRTAQARKKKSSPKSPTGTPGRSSSPS